MIKTSKQKTQSKTVVHEGKVYRGVMPNLNMKTDLTDSFEYIATIVEGMSSGNQNGNPIYEDFKQEVIKSTISGEVGKLINERGHVPENYDPSPHLGRYSSKVNISTDMPCLSRPKPLPKPLPNFPTEVGNLQDALVQKMIDNGAIQINVDGSIKSPDEMTMEKLQGMFDDYEKKYTPEDAQRDRLKAKVLREAKEKGYYKGSKPWMGEPDKLWMEDPEQWLLDMKKKASKKKKTTKKKMTKKKTTKKKVAKKTKKKITKKKAKKLEEKAEKKSKKRISEKDMIIAR